MTTALTTAATTALTDQLLQPRHPVLDAELDLVPDDAVRDRAGRVLDLPAAEAPVAEPVREPEATTTVSGTAIAQMVAALSTELGTPLVATRVAIRGGGRVTLDAASPDLRVLVHACPRQGRPSAEQLHELHAAAFRLAYLAGGLPVRPERLILLMCDADAARPVKHGTSWGVQAVRAAGVEVRVVEISDDVRADLRAGLR